MNLFLKTLSLICLVSILPLHSAKAAPRNLDSVVGQALTEASRGTPLSPEQAKLVLQALIASVKGAQLVCSSTKAVSAYYTNEDMISNFLSFENLVVTISTDHSQPVLTVSKLYDQTDGQYEVTAEFTTTADFKSIDQAFMSSETLTSKSVNVGNLINPVFENQKTRVTAYEMRCLPMSRI